MGYSQSAQAKSAAAGVLLMFSLVSGLQLVVMKAYTLVDRDQVIEIRTLKTKVQDVLEAADIHLGPYDRVSKLLDAHLKNNEILVIDRGIQVQIKEGILSHTLEAYSKSTVSEVLKQQGITLQTHDKIDPTLDSVLNEGSYVTLKRIQKEVETTTTDIPYPVVFKVSPKLKVGESRVVKSGQIGQIQRTLEKTFENGSLIEELLISEEAISSPKEEVIEIAEEKFFVTSRGKPYRVAGVYVMRATAYDLSFQSTGKLPGDRGYGITKLGTKARPGVVAVDPSIIPLGSKLYIESTDGFMAYGFAIAEDIGGAIKGNKIDLFVEDYALARRFGVRNVRVYILDETIADAEYTGFGSGYAH
jgi:uncharacterized protein YabE (DUF348 family)/3D (Asp-Asp-Asp) domain-containing protein